MPVVQFSGLSPLSERTYYGWDLGQTTRERDWKIQKKKKKHLDKTIKIHHTKELIISRTEFLESSMERHFIQSAARKQSQVRKARSRESWSLQKKVLTLRAPFGGSLLQHLVGKCNFLTV